MQDAAAHLIFGTPPAPDTCMSKNADRDRRYSGSNDSGGSQDQDERKDERFESRQGGSQSQGKRREGLARGEDHPERKD